jgi:hypothetical protein
MYVYVSVYNYNMFHTIKTTNIWSITTNLHAHKVKQRTHDWIWSACKRRTAGPAVGCGQTLTKFWSVVVAALFRAADEADIGRFKSLPTTKRTPDLTWHSRQSLFTSSVDAAVSGVGVVRSSVVAGERTGFVTARERATSDRKKWGETRERSSRWATPRSHAAKKVPLVASRHTATSSTAALIV